MLKMKRMTAFLMSALLMGSAVYAPVMAAEIPADDAAEVSVIEEVPEAEESAEEAEIEVTEEPQVQQSSEEAMASGNRRNSFAEEGEYQTSYKLGDEVTLPVNVYNSSSSLTFEWAMGYCELNDENGPSVYSSVGNSTSSYTFTPDKIGVYYFRCSVGYGEQWDSLSFAFDVLNHIIVEGADEDDVITVQANAGEDTVLEINAHAADGSALTYAWYDEEWNSIPAETSNRLTVRVEDSCEYYCEIAAQDGLTDYGDEPMTYTSIRFDVNVSGHKHTYGDWVVTKEATCTEDGTQERVCSGCGNVETEVIPAGHKWNWEYTIDKMPTDTEEGYMSIHCMVCDAIREGSTVVLPVLVGEWHQDLNGWWYDNGDGTYAKNEFKVINGATYYFDRYGYMVTGWEKIGGKWYMFNGSGVMQTGWQQIYGAWFYFNENGTMQTGWKQIDGLWYYFSESGAMVTNWQKLGGVWYYFNASGAMVTGWQSSGGKWYYLGESGAMQTGWQKIDNVWYYFASNGVMQTGWQKLGGVWYHFDGSGAMQTGFQDIGGATYYFDENGAMKTGWQQIDGNWYDFDASGAMIRGRWVGNYYLTESGVMATNQWIDGKYYVGPDGLWIPGYTE